MKKSDYSIFKEHPKGLYALFFTEMWERFAFYTMVAIFTLYLGERFNWSATEIGNVYGFYMALVYFTPLLGGILADKFFGYFKTITTGAAIMFIGYGALAFPTDSVLYLYIALSVAAIGNGMFKANISTLVGALYEGKESSLKDAAFNIFYMGINIGAFLAPLAAKEIKHLFLTLGFSLADSYNFVFAASSLGMIISLIIFIKTKKYYIEFDISNRSADVKFESSQISRKSYWMRVLALLIVYFIVIFFWMAFHQNGFTLTLFAKNFTVRYVDRFTYSLFDTIALISLIAMGTSIFILTKEKFLLTKINKYWLAVLFISLVLFLYKLFSFDDANKIDPENFLIFNPMFIVFITPLIILFFKYLHSKNLEPSAPAKIGIGMFLAGIAFMIMVFASYNFGTIKSEIMEEHLRVSPYWLILTYLIITVAEIFLSPMGLSFVSKIAPPDIKAIMMGGWFVATAIGNYLSGFIGRFYDKWQLWEFFLALAAASFFASMLTFVSLKFINKASLSEN